MNSRMTPSATRMTARASGRRKPNWVSRIRARSGTQAQTPTSRTASAARRNAASRSWVASWWMTGETVSIASNDDRPDGQTSRSSRILAGSPGRRRNDLAVAVDWRPRSRTGGRARPAASGGAGDPPIAVRQVRRQLGRNDVALDHPQQERPVALGQRRLGGHARSRPDTPGPRGAGRRAHRSPRRRGRCSGTRHDALAREVGCVIPARWRSSMRPSWRAPSSARVRERLDGGRTPTRWRSARATAGGEAQSRTTPQDG